MSYVWSDEEPQSSKKGIYSQDDDYDEDFENEAAVKKQSSSHMPKIGKQKSEAKKLKNFQSNQSKQDADCQATYTDDFNQDQQKGNKTSNSNQQSKNRMESHKKLNINAEKTPSTSHIRQIKSLSIRSKNSQSKQSKYLQSLKQQFPFTRQQIETFPSQRINRLNQKLRKYINSINDQLTEMINQNMRKLKDKSHKTVVKSNERTTQDQIRLLTEQVKTGQLTLSRMDKENKDLASKQNSLKEQVEILIIQQLDQVKACIKDATKEILILKREMNDQGNKLTDESHVVERMNDVNQNLNAVKREDIKEKDKLQKQAVNLKDLQSKNKTIDQHLEKLYAQCKQKNVQIVPTQQDQKKKKNVTKLQQKIEILKSHSRQSKHLSDTKLGQIKRDNQFLRIELAKIDQKYGQIDKQIQLTQLNSKRAIHQSRSMKPELKASIVDHLNFILLGIEDGSNLEKPNRNGFTKNYYLTQHKGQSKNTNSKLPEIKKHSSVAGLHAQRPQHQSDSRQTSFNIHKKNPLNINNKDKPILKISEKQTETKVWKDKQKAPQNENYQKRIDSAKKPFNLRKQVDVAQKSRQSSKFQLDINKPQVQINALDKPNIQAPKMMKFKKTINTQEQKANEKQNQVQIEKQNKKIETLPGQINSDKISQNVASKPRFSLKKAQKDKIEIPQQQSNAISASPASSNVIQKPWEIDQTKANFIAQHPKAQKPRFKIKKAQKEKVQIPQQQLNPFLIQPEQNKQIQKLPLNIPQQHKDDQKVQKSEGEINFGGRRQAQRKIKRKEQDSYVL